jgi:hypothetical protein
MYVCVLCCVTVCCGSLEEAEAIDDEEGRRSNTTPLGDGGEGFTSLPGTQRHR